MKFKSVSQFRIYLVDKLLSERVLRKHMNIFEDRREMTDIKKDKTNQTWDWMKYDTIYLVRTSEKQDFMTYIYSSKDDSDEKKRIIYYALKNIRLTKQHIKDPSIVKYTFGPFNINTWDATNNNAEWIQAIFEVDSGDILLMNWNNIPWEDLK